ncbi:MAG: SUMF1/EgtB/PvdO family nonheme iron enzyme, partial [Planctomycetota bacterium]
GQRCTSKVEVRRGSLRVLVNGEEYLSWTVDFKRLSLEAIFKLRDDNHIGVGSVIRGVVFHRIEVREVSGKGTFARPEDPAAKEAEKKRSGAAAAPPAVPPETANQKPETPPAPPPAQAAQTTGGRELSQRVFGQLAQKGADVPAKLNAARELLKGTALPETQALAALVDKAAALHAKALQNLAATPPTEPVQIEKMQLTGAVARIAGGKAYIKSQGMEMPVDVALMPSSVFLNALGADSTPDGLADRAAYQLALGDAGVARSLLNRLEKGKRPAWADLLEQYSNVADAPVVAAGALQAPAKRTETAKVLILTGMDLPVHKWRETAPVVAQLLRRDSRMVVEVSENLEVLSLPGINERNAIVLHFSSLGHADPSFKARAGLQSFLQLGRGVVLLHSACAAYSDWPEFPALAGIAWKSKVSSTETYGALQVRIAEQKNPITDGLRSFETTDELYKGLLRAPSITVLAAGVSKMDGKEYPVAIAHEYAKGRVFNCVLGHDVAAFCNEDTAELIRRGTAWAAGLTPVNTPRTEAPALPAASPQKPEPAALPKETTLDLGGGVKMEMVLVPAGEFMMGSDNEGGDATEKPVHKVKISKPLYMGKYHVTQEQFEALMGNNPSKFIGPKNPVETVSWDDAQEFCKKLSAKTGKRIQLPTEAQWEYACRAGTTTRYNTGDRDSDLEQAGWFRNNSGMHTNACGQKNPNAWRLYDMHGNVWQWCQDWYNDKYYVNSPPVDPKAPAKGGMRVLRGGSWHNDPDYCRAAHRSWDDPGHRSSSNGFRCALDF